MSGAIEALYVYDSHNAVILQHRWRHRPSATASELINIFTSHPAPRPPLLYLSHLSPPTLLFNIIHNNLTFLSPVTAEIEPLQVLEFLHRVVDVFEEYFGAPLVPTKIEANYDIVSELLGEMCDDGLLCNTEPNGLRDVVLPPSLMKKLLGNVTLPSGSLDTFRTQPAAISTIPWRRANVKHTSNEMYLDLIETLHCILAPSGRPLAARVNGTMAFTCQISGIPDLLLSLRAPSGRSFTSGHTGKEFLESPVFHPCVRLSRWNQMPGDLSFVPPDGKFVLASYETNLIPNAPNLLENFQLPVNLTMKTLLGTNGTEFEVKVWVPNSSPYIGAGTGGSSSSSAASSASAAFSRIATQSAGNTIPIRFDNSGGTSSNPAIEDISVVIPLPPQVRSVLNVRVSKGSFYHETDGRNELRWQFPTTTPSVTSSLSSQGIASVLGPGQSATLRAEVVSKSMAYDDDEDDDDGGDDNNGKDGENKSRPASAGFSSFDNNYEVPTTTTTTTTTTAAKKDPSAAKLPSAAAKIAMPRSALLNFTLKGTLMSGLKVDSLKIVGGKGIGENVKPYKGVKYMTLAAGGSLEFRV